MSGEQTDRFLLLLQRRCPTCVLSSWGNADEGSHRDGWNWSLRLVLLSNPAVRGLQTTG